MVCPAKGCDKDRFIHQTYQGGYDVSMPDLPEASASPSPPAPSKARRLLKRTLIYLFVIYILWLVIAFTIQRSILFPSGLVGGAAGAPGVSAPPGVEVLTLDIPGGQVEAWFIPGEGVSADSPGPLVVFAHGNAELIDHWPDGLRGYKQLGISVLLPEFRSYGRSDGEPSQQALKQDYIQFYDLVAAKPEVDPARVILHGRSIGGAVVAQLATERPSAAMIQQSSPASIKRMARRFLAPGLLVKDPFDSVKVIESYPSPVLVMHGSKDMTIPPSHANLLAQASTHPNTKLILYGVDHNTLPPAGPYWDHIEQFLEDAHVLP